MTLVVVNSSPLSVSSAELHICGGLSPARTEEEERSSETATINGGKKAIDTVFVDLIYQMYVHSFNFSSVCESLCYSCRVERRCVSVWVCL